MTRFESLLPELQAAELAWPGYHRRRRETAVICAYGKGCVSHPHFLSHAGSSIEDIPEQRWSKGPAAFPPLERKGLCP